MDIPERGGGSATTCWRRLDEWARAGVFEQLQAVLLDELGEASRLDLERVLVDSASVRAVKGGADRRNPVDRGKQGTKLRVRYERCDERFFTFAMLACSAILFNTLQQPPW